MAKYEHLAGTNTYALHKAMQRSQPETGEWSTYKHAEAGYNQTFRAVLQGRTISDLALLFQNTSHNPVIVDVMSPTTLLDAMSTHIQPMHGLAVGLGDLRPEEIKKEQASRGVNQLKANILPRQTWKRRSKYSHLGIHDWVNKQNAESADIVLCRPGGGFTNITNRPKVLFGLLDRMYKTARSDGGIILASIPSSYMSAESLSEGFEPRLLGISTEEITQWAEEINGSNLGIEVRYVPGQPKVVAGEMMIIRSASSPDRLPTPKDLQLMRVNLILNDIRLSQQMGDLLSGGDRIKRLINRAKKIPDAIARTDSQIDDKQFTMLEQKLDRAIALERQRRLPDLMIPNHQDFRVSAVFPEDIPTEDDGIHISEDIANEKFSLVANTPNGDEISIFFAKDGTFRLWINFYEEGKIETQFDSSPLPLSSMTKEEYELINYCLNRALITYRPRTK